MPAKRITNNKKYDRRETIIQDKIYSIVDENANKRISQLKACIQRFIQSRQDALYDYAPIDRIYFGKKDETDFFNSIDIDIKIIHNILPELYYYKKDELQACKDPFSLTMFMTLRWIMINKPKDEKLTELAYMYLVFSGKFYASCHAKWFPKYTPKREVMDYVINYMLSAKYDIVKTKSLWGAVKNLTSSWINSYKNEIVKDITDERIIYIIHQLYSRLYGFLRNIAKPYFEAYEKKLYLNVESDDYSEDNFRLTQNNSTIASTITEKTMTYMVNSQVNLSICKIVASSGVDPFEIKAIFENILNTNQHLDELRYVINVMVVDYMKTHPNSKEYTGVDFISYSTTLKPNTKDKNILRMKDIILQWLNTSSRYKSIKTQATKNNYFRAILGYIAMAINTANKEK